ncbi:NAC transcription factor ONAC010-like [Juglans microcarpa x Juglans regia]|uniref:NAC transcription factor ONAC010-like n=1 Tax=Juglans microcarpa x Juglans regia TaxID=2249226 RepID=UPI001B7E2E38|nr:NAC transcription factor ONAC010-like [Juglans microcarpa x Juglans regia]
MPIDNSPNQPQTLLTPVLFDGFHNPSIKELEEHLRHYPTGYRFCPTDVELVGYYLQKKISNQPVLPVSPIVSANVYLHKPEFLSEIFKDYGQTDYWYFFTPRDRKYRNGSRPSRSANGGYWKATGADKPIIDSYGKLIGFKKSFVDVLIQTNILYTYCWRDVDHNETSILDDSENNDQTPSGLENAINIDPEPMAIAHDQFSNNLHDHQYQEGALVDPADQMVQPAIDFRPPAPLVDYTENVFEPVWNPTYPGSENFKYLQDLDFDYTDTLFADNSQLPDDQNNQPFKRPKLYI